MKTIADYLESQLQGERTKLWSEGTINEGKVESEEMTHDEG